MTKKKRLRKLKLLNAKREREEIERLKKLRLDHPDLYRLCGDDQKPCCQARTLDGYKCMRAALTTKSYINRVKCCLLCWQHALAYGVYGLLKVGQMAAENTLSWDEYCNLYPEKCDEYFGLQEEYVLPQ